MNPNQTLEFKPIGEPAHLDWPVEPEAREKGNDDPDRSRDRRSFKRAWARRKRRRSSTASLADTPSVLSAAEEHALAARIKAGDTSAEQQLVMVNLGLVRRAVIDYRKCGVPEDDLIQEGNLGLIRAARQFDPSAHPARFMTYATYWIRSFMARALASNGSLVNLLRMQQSQASSELRAEQSAESGEAGAKAQELDQTARYLGVPSDRLEQSELVQNHQATCESLDDLTPADDPEPDRLLLINEDRALVNAALRRLSPFEAWVISERFGLGELSGRATRAAATRTGPRKHGRPSASDRLARAELEQSHLRRPSESYFQRSYFEMGRDCGLSVFRMRQVERTALDKLRRILGAGIAEGP